jgi:hypothetical protein
MNNLIPSERIEQKILFIRGQKVILDYDLAGLYRVETKYLKRQVKRNRKRFPEDFMFQLTRNENLRCQNVTSSYGGRRYLPYAFTEQGVAMLSSILNSDRAIEVNIAIMRVFVRLRQILATHKELAAKLNELETKVGGHSSQISQIFTAIRHLMNPPVKKQRKIGFLRQE